MPLTKIKSTVADLAELQAVLTPDKLSTSTGTAPSYSARAWVNFNGVPLTGTYSQTGTLVTVTITTHGMESGMIANVTPTTGTGVAYTDRVITKTDANTYTYVAGTSLTTSGNITQNLYIRAAGNVSSITDNGVGDYTINFTNAMSDVNYAAVHGGVIDWRTVGASDSTTTYVATTYYRVVTRRPDNAAVQDSAGIHVAIFR